MEGYGLVNHRLSKNFFKQFNMEESKPNDTPADVGLKFTKTSEEEEIIDQKKVPISCWKSIILVHENKTRYIVCSE